MGQPARGVGTVYTVRSEAWGEEVFVLVEGLKGAVAPEGYQPVNIRARFGQFLLACQAGERQVFIGHGGEETTYEVVRIVRPS